MGYGTHTIRRPGVHVCTEHMYGLIRTPHVIRTLYMCVYPFLVWVATPGVHLVLPTLELWSHSLDSMASHCEQHLGQGREFRGHITGQCVVRMYVCMHVCMYVLRSSTALLANPSESRKTGVFWAMHCIVGHALGAWQDELGARGSQCQWHRGEPWERGAGTSDPRTERKRKRKKREKREKREEKKSTTSATCRLSKQMPVGCETLTGPASSSHVHMYGACNISLETMRLQQPPAVETYMTCTPCMYASNWERIQSAVM